VKTSVPNSKSAPQTADSSPRDDCGETAKLPLPIITKGTPKTSRLKGVLSLAQLTESYGQRGYLETMRHFRITPTDYSLLVKDSSQRDGLLTITPEEFRRIKAENISVRGVYSVPANVKTIAIEIFKEKIPGFAEAFTSGDLPAIAALYRVHVIGYPRGQKKFLADCDGLTLLATIQEMGGKRSASGLLSLVIPGLVDHRNPKLLHPLELERGYWNNIENIKRHVFDALYTIPGFEVAHKAYNIERMAALYLEGVVGYKSKHGEQHGQIVFLDEMAGMAGFICDPHPKAGLAERGVKPLLNLLLPGLIDDRSLLALKSSLFESFWDKKENVHQSVLNALHSLAGFKEAHERGDVATMAAIYRGKVIGYRPNESNIGGQKNFYAVHGVGRAFSAPRDTESSRISRCFQSLRDTLPALCDSSHPYALRRSDIATSRWAKEISPELLLKCLRNAEGFNSGDIAAMANLFRQLSKAYRTSDPSPLSTPTLTLAPQTGETARIYETMREIIPILFDPNNPDAIRKNEAAARFWDRETLTKGILQALYTIPGFQVAHLAHNIPTMAELYTNHVCGYQAKRWETNGQRSFFWEHGLNGAMVRTRPEFGIMRRNSPFALLKFAIPELVDEHTQGALKEKDLTVYYWTVKDNAIKGVVEALDKVPGFTAARTIGDIATMADLYRKHVMGFTSSTTGRGGQQAFFVEVGGLVTLLNRARENYNWKKAGSPAELLRLAVPELLDPTHPDSLDRTEVEMNVFKDPEVIREYCIAGLCTIEGFSEALELHDIAAMAELYRKHVLPYHSLDGKTIGQQAFFKEVCNLSAVLVAARRELGITKADSPAQILRFAIPNLVDAGNPVALHPLDIERSYWTKPENVRSEVLEALYRIPGFASAHQTNLIDTMAELYRAHVLEYTSEIGGGQYAWFKDCARMPVLRLSFQESDHERHAKPYEVINFVIPGLVDDLNPQALSMQELTLNYWTNPTNIIHSVLRALYTIPGFKEAHQDSNIGAMADLYRQNVLSAENQDGTKGRQGGFFKEHGLIGIFNRDKEFNKENGERYASILQFVIPGLVDEENSRALKRYELTQGMWKDPDYIAHCVRSALFTIPGFESAYRELDIAAMAALYRAHVLRPHGDRAQRKFLEEAGLVGALVQMRYHGHASDSGISNLISLAVPGLVNDASAVALKGNELSSRYWTKERAIERVRFLMRQLPGFTAAEEFEDIATMAQIYRSKVIGYYDPIRQAGGQSAYYAHHQVAGAFYREYAGSLTPATALELAFPDLVDASNPEALAPSELSWPYYTELEMVRSTMRTALYRIPAFEAAHRRGDTDQMFSLYRTHVAGYRSKVASGGGQHSWICEWARLGAMLRPGALSGLGVAAIKTGCIPAALVNLVVPELAEKIVVLQSERSVAFLRGAAFERICSFLLSYSRRSVASIRLNTQLATPSDRPLYPDFLVGRTIVDCKWGRAYRDLVDTVEKYAALAELEENREKVDRVDYDSPIILLTLDAKRPSLESSTNISHRIVDVLDLLNAEPVTESAQYARTLFSLDLSEEERSVFGRMFSHLRALEHQAPDDFDRNFFCINSLLVELEANEMFDRAQVFTQLSQLEQILGSLIDSTELTTDSGTGPPQLFKLDTMQAA